MVGHHIRAAVLIGVCLVLAAPATVSADTLVGHSGRIGAHSLTDSWEYPGVKCSYDGDMNAVRVRVRPPTVFARDRTTSRDSQWVGWSIELRFHPSEGGTWQTVQTSSLTKVRTWDDTPAPFRTRSVTISHPKGSGRWRVVARMIWYAPGTTGVWQGTARHRYTFYDYPLTEPGAADFCPAGIL